MDILFNKKKIDFETMDKPEDFEFEHKKEETEFVNREFIEKYPPLEALTAAPNHNVSNFFEQIRIYDTGGVQRLYIKVGSTWRYATLT